MSNLMVFRRLAASRGWSRGARYTGPERRRPGRRGRRRAFRRRSDRYFLTALAVLALGTLVGALGAAGWHGLTPVGSADANRAGAPGRTVSGQVVAVLDGDTFQLDCCARRIRLWGIDAPERRTRAGPVATAALRSLIAGSTLDCRQRDMDRYGRIVGQCTLADGSDLGQRLLQTGTVREYCVFSRNHYRTC